MKKLIWLIMALITTIALHAQQVCGAYSIQEPSGTTPLYNETMQWNIPVVFHIILSSTSEGDVSDAVLQSQMALLNQKYDSTDFSFYLLGIRRIKNDYWRNITTAPNVMN